MRKACFPLLTALVAANVSFAQGNDQAMLEQILSELRSLNDKVAKLEERVAKFESEPVETAPSPKSVAEYVVANPVEKENRNKWYENLRIELKKADARASGDWVKPEAWEKVALKMKPEEVVAILGKPTRTKFSIRKDTDEIFVYEADLRGDGNPLKGEVRIYKGKVNRIAPPEF